MRAIAFFAPALATLCLGACGGKVFVDAPTGAGSGNGGATTSSSTVFPDNTTTVNGTTTSFDGPSSTVGPGGDPCANGGDCSQCPDFQSCSQCETNNHPEGAKVFNDLIDCVYCTACFDTCQGAAQGCASAPPVKDTCDVGTGTNACIDNNMNPPTGCIPCAEVGTCKGKIDACKNDSDCIAYNNALQACPVN